MTKKAVLHIGTEKTGSTSIQRYLVENRAQLMSEGYLFPKSCGFLNNQKLVAFVKAEAAPRLLQDAGISADDERAQADWCERFIMEHCLEVIPFQQQHAEKSTVIYSAEHLQSRLSNVQQLERLKSMLLSFYDDIEIIVYLRRQDRFAISRHSTVLRAGYDLEFSFEAINRTSLYYDHLALLTMWSEVFGESSVTARIFESAKLIDRDVVADFKSTAGLPAVGAAGSGTSKENRALSITAQTLMRHFNRIPDEDPRLAGLNRGSLLGYMNERLEQISDDYGKCLPARASARAFMAHFADANQQVTKRWLAGVEFDDSFDDYPEVASIPPGIDDADEQLTTLIADFAAIRR